jgi:phage terminase large subunit-like protein
LRGSNYGYVLTRRKLEEVIERFRKRVEEEGEPSELAKAKAILEVTPALIAVWKALYERRLREKHVLWAASGIHVLFPRGDSIEIRPFSEYLLNGVIASEGEGFELNVLKKSLGKGVAAKALKEFVKESTGIPKARVEIEGWKTILLGVRWKVRFSLGEGGGEFLISDLSEEEVMDWPPIGEKKAIEIARREASALAGRGARRSTRGVRIVRSWDSLFVERKGFRARASLIDEDERRYLLLARSDERRFLLELSKLTGRVLGHREVPTEEEIEERILKVGKDLGIELKIEKELFHEGILQLRASDEKGWYSLLFVCDSDEVKLLEIEVTSTGLEEMLRLFSEDAKAKVISHAYSKGLLKISGEGREGRYSLLIDISKPGEPKLLDFKVRKGLLDRIRHIFLK